MSAEDKKEFFERAAECKATQATDRQLLMQGDSPVTDATAMSVGASLAPHAMEVAVDPPATAVAVGASLAPDATAAAVDAPPAVAGSGAEVETLLGNAGACLTSGAFLGEWQVLRFLGGGTYGHVFLAVDRLSGVRLAVRSL